MKTLTLSINNNEDAHVNSSVYRLLHDNFIFSDRHISENYIKKGEVTFNQLRKLCRKNNFNYVMFFAPKTQLQKIVKQYNESLYGSIDNKEIITGSRSGPTDLRAIRWILADLIAKKNWYKKYGNNVRLEKLCKYLQNSKKDNSQQADYVLKRLAITREDIRSKRDKRETYKYLCRKLSESHIHVATEAQNCMPQNIPKNMLSGLYIRDNFNPMILICNEISGHPEEGLGRKIYTLTFLLVALFKGESFAISINNSDYSVSKKRNKNLQTIHDITHEILMPSSQFQGKTFSTKEDIIKESSVLKVSPTALLVRLRDLKLLDSDYNALKKELNNDFQRYVKQKKREEAEARRQGKGGPTLKTMYKSYQGDFIDFIKTKVPEPMRKSLFEKHIVYGRSFIDYGDL